MEIEQCIRYYRGTRIQRSFGARYLEADENLNIKAMYGRFTRIDVKGEGFSPMRPEMPAKLGIHSNLILNLPQSAEDFLL